MYIGATLKVNCMIKKEKEYLGDGLYAETDGFHLKLTAENGVTVENIVYLEDFVLRALIKYLNLTVVTNGEKENE